MRLDLKNKKYWVVLLLMVVVFSNSKKSFRFLKSRAHQVYAFESKPQFIETAIPHFGRFPSQTLKSLYYFRESFAGKVLYVSNKTISRTTVYFLRHFSSVDVVWGGSTEMNRIKQPLIDADLMIDGKKLYTVDPQSSKFFKLRRLGDSLELVALGK